MPRTELGVAPSVIVDHREHQRRRQLVPVTTTGQGRASRGGGWQRRPVDASRAYAAVVRSALIRRCRAVCRKPRARKPRYTFVMNSAAKYSCAFQTISSPRRGYLAASLCIK